MTTTFLEAEAELSRQLGDYWSSTTTGAGTATTLVDTALKAKANDWIDGDREMYSFLIEEPGGAASIYDERKISSLDNSTGTLTALAFDAAPGTGIDYEVHRLFTPSEKRRALVAAARRVFPELHVQILTETLRMGDWLRNGDMQKFTTGTGPPDEWNANSLTAAKNTTKPFYLFGDKSVKLTSTAGNLSQSNTENILLNQLQGKTVSFEARGWSDTASSLRLQVYDGTTTTSSDYHTGGSSFDDPRDEILKITNVTIADEPTEITFRIVHDSASATDYVQDARVLNDWQDRIFIGDMGLAQNIPHAVYQTHENWIHDDNWERMNDWFVDKDGYLHVPRGLRDYFLKIEGIGYLDFVDSSGDSGTDWDDTININQPQLEVLVAEAALWLYTTMTMPNFDSGQREDFERMIGFWRQEVRSRRGKFGMDIPSATTKWQ